MKQYEVSNIILKHIFDYSSRIIIAEDPETALKEYISDLIIELQNISDQQIKNIVKQADGCIYDPIVLNIKK